MDESSCFDVESSLLYVDQELHILGFPTLTSSLTSVRDSDIKEKIVMVLLQLVRLHRKNMRIIEELRESWSKGKSDVIMQREAQARLKEDLKSGEKELAVMEDRERQLIQKAKMLTSKLRAEQDEVRRLKVNMQYKETQRNHENKKKEKELERMKEKLGQLVTDRNHERHLGVSMLNALQKGDGKRKTWSKPGSGDEEMYRSIISNYEERQKELMLENASLRESLAGMEKQLIELLNEKQTVLRRDQDQESNIMESKDDTRSISSGHFQMPYDIVRDGIEMSFREKCQLLKDTMDELKLKIEALEEASESSGGQESAEIRKLEHRLSDYKDIITQQEEMLLQRNPSSEEERRELSSSGGYPILEQEGKVKRELESLREQKENLAKERQRCLEAAHTLDYERMIFEEQKVTFLQDKLNISRGNSSQELDSFFNKLCSTPARPMDSSLPKYLITHSESDISNSSGVSTSLLQDSVTHCEVDLKQDLSMCSDDGMCVLNERPKHDVYDGNMDST